jgi:hypothetical protein
MHQLPMKITTIRFHQLSTVHVRLLLVSLQTSQRTRNLCLNRLFTMIRLNLWSRLSEHNIELSPTSSWIPPPLYSFPCYDFVLSHFTMIWALKKKDVFTTNEINSCTTNNMFRYYPKLNHQMKICLNAIPHLQEPKSIGKRCLPGISWLYPMLSVHTSFYFFIFLQHRSCGAPTRYRRTRFEETTPARESCWSVAPSRSTCVNIS